MLPKIGLGPPWQTKLHISPGHPRGKISGSAHEDETNTDHCMHLCITSVSVHVHDIQGFNTSPPTPASLHLKKIIKA